MTPKIPIGVQKGITFKFKGKFWDWVRQFCWTYGWSGRQYGLQMHDHCWEPAPEVREALRRLRLKDPYAFDQRLQRMMLAQQLANSNERLPREQWTKWEDETFYLKPYLEEVEQEKLERNRSSGLKPGYQLKHQV